MAMRAGVDKAAKEFAASKRAITSTGLKSALLAWGVFSASQALALGLGEMSMRSFLNEPLQAEVELLDLRDLTEDDIRIRLAGVEDFDRLGIDRSYFLTSIQFDIEIDDATGRGVIRLSTDDAVLEPYLDLVVEARWPTGRLLREYTVLVDPPTFRQETVTVSASEEVARSEGRAEAAAEGAGTDASAGSSGQTGDTVRRLESDLPPGEMPARPFSARTSEQPQAGSRYMVKRDETLWEIASRARPEGVAVQQAMLDIQRLNPEAFIQGNINRIKAGYIVYLPSAQDISSDDLAQALDEVRQQNQDFAAGRPTPGVTAAATLRVSAAPSEAATPAVDDEAGDATPAASGGTGAGTGAPVPGGAAVSGDTQTAAAPMPESADVAAGGDSAASAELAAQLDSMADRLDTLEQIVTLKDEQIATLEQALREAREAAAAAPAAATTPERTPAPAPQPVSQPQRADSGLPWLPIGGGIAVVLALLALLVVRRRGASDDQDAAAPSRGRASRTQEQDDDVFAGVSLDKGALAAPADDEQESLEARLQREEEERAQAEAEPEEADNRGYGERKHDDYIDEGAAGDALAEADIYIAYGRYLQAIELLDTAIAAEPGNSAYRLKLIELYVDMGEEGNAAEQLQALRASGDAAAIARGEALVGGATASAPTLAIDEEAPDSPSTQGLGEGSGMEDGDDTPEHGAEESAEESAKESAEERAEDNAETLSLDLELSDDAPSDGSESADDFESSAPGDDGIDAQGDDDALEFDDDLEFEDLQIEDDRDDEEPEDLLSATSEEEILDFTDALEGVDLPGDSKERTEEGASSALNGDSLEDDMVIAEDADQMATKLDLARAYLDMGDNDGAKVILEEVMGAGSDDQQQEARELLSRIG